MFYSVICSSKQKVTLNTFLLPETETYFFSSDNYKDLSDSYQ